MIQNTETSTNPGALCLHPRYTLAYHPLGILKDMCASSRVRRILVIDDDSLSSETLAEMLLENGYSPRVASSGEQAVDLARVSEPDMLISDVTMGGMTGIETANAVLSFLPSCKVILFSWQATTLGSSSFRQRARTDFEIVAKPLSPEALLNCIANLA